MSSDATGEAERRKIAGRAGIVAAGTLTSRALGLVREGVIAAIFARASTDAFFVAFTIPNVLRQLLAEGAMQTAVLPVLAETRERAGTDEARRLFRALRGLSLLALTATSIAGIVLARPLVELFAAGFHDHPGQFERTVTLTRWVFPYILFMGTAALGAAALNAHKRFVASAFAPALLNVALIASAFGLPLWMSAHGYDPVLALAIGAGVGGVLQVVAQWPSLARIGYLDRPRLALSDPGVRKVLRRMLPVLAGIAIYVADVMLTRRFLSELGVGSQSYFSWAQRLVDVPQAVFALALQTATLPTLAVLYARGDRAELGRTFAFGMRLSLFIGVAATALLVALAHPIVVLIYERGQFDAVAAHETARALVAQGSAVWTVAAIRQLVVVYYALGDTRTPVVVSALDLGVLIVLALALRGPLGQAGVSWAVAGSSAAQMLLLWIGVRRRLGETHSLGVLRSAARTAIAAGSAAIVAALVVRVFEARAGAGALGRAMPGVAGIAIFALVFVIAARLVKSEELDATFGVVRRRLGKST